MPDEELKPLEGHDKDLLEKYRDMLEKLSIESESEFHKAAMYITASALGLFLTINENFFDLKEAKGGCFMIISIVLLVLTLLMILIWNWLNSLFSNDMILKVDDYINGQISYETINTVLKTKNKRLSLLTITFIVMLVGGLAMEVIFLKMNVFSENKKKDADKSITVVLPVGWKAHAGSKLSDSASLNNDTIHIFIPKNTP